MMSRVEQFEQIQWTIYLIYILGFFGVENQVILQQNHNSQQMYKGKKEKGTAPFIFKLYQLLEESGNSELAVWAPQPNTFTICNVSQFCQQLLPKYYKHSNFSSFVRQLNIYGFTKTKVDSTEHSYHNPNFGQGARHKLRFIKRKPVLSRSDQDSRGSQHFEPTQKKCESSQFTSKMLEKAMQGLIKQQNEKNRELVAQNYHLLQNSCDLVIHILRHMNLVEQKYFPQIRHFVSNSLKQNQPFQTIFSTLLTTFHINEPQSAQKVSQLINKQQLSSQSRKQPSTFSLNSRKQSNLDNFIGEDLANEGNDEESFRMLEEIQSNNFEFMNNLENPSGNSNDDDFAV